jgi:two-component sensor histidine kinase
MRWYLKAPAIFLTLCIYAAVLFVFIPPRHINIAYPLILVPSAVFAVFWGPWFASGAALGFTLLNLVYLYTRMPGYFETGLQGFVLGHFNVLLAAVVIGFVSDLRKRLKNENRRRRISEEKLQQALAQKDRLIQEIHHRIKNHLSFLSAMVNLQSGYFEAQGTRRKFKELSQRIITIALIHDQLYKTEDRVSVDLHAYLKDLTDKLLEARGDHSLTVDIDLDVPSMYLPTDTTTTLGLIVSELITNAFKYAFSGRNRGRVGISVEEWGEGSLKLIVSNDGDPLPEEQEWRKKDSLGLNLIEGLARQIGGDLEIHYSRPVSFTVRFPVAFA